jgi:hypothetical protein
MGKMPGHVTTPFSSSQYFFQKVREKKGRTKHVQSPLQIRTNIVQHRTKRRRKQRKAHHAHMTPANNLRIRRVAVKVLSVNIETDD